MPTEIQAKTILNKKKQRDSWFLDDYTINPYSGCSFNCLYCYIRGSKYGIHMEEKLAVKTNAVELLEKQLALRAKKNQYGIIVLASATDPYLQFEKELQLTRKLLEVILKFRFPVHIITKSDLVIRDFDLLQQIEAAAILPEDLQHQLKRKVFITFSFSCIDDGLGKIFEPGATPPSVRLKIVQAALAAGFHSGVSLMPLLPFITDTDEQLEFMYKTFHSTGVKYLFPAGLTLFGDGPADSKTLLFRAIEKHFPQYITGYRQLYENDARQSWQYQQQLNSRCKSLGIKYGIQDRINVV